MENEDQLKQNALDLGTDVADIAIDMLTKNELLKELPVVGLIYKSIKTLISIPDTIFLYKAAKFFQTVNQKTTKQQRLDFTEELKKDAKKREKLYSDIFLKIDKFDDISKSDLFAKIFACFILGKIRKEDFTELSSALNLASLGELMEFSSSYWKDKNHFHRGVYSLPGSDYGSVLSAKLVEINLEHENHRTPNTTGILMYHLEYKITELGCLYAYISQDFEDYFMFMDNSERSYQNRNRIYHFEAPWSNKDFERKVQQRWPSDRYKNLA